MRVMRVGGRGNRNRTFEAIDSKMKRRWESQLGKVWNMGEVWSKKV